MLLELEHISKAFPGVQALDRVSLQLDAGEVVGLVGENGAGKSTLLKILGGIHSPDSGLMIVGGERLAHLDVRQSMGLGIQLIHQELNLAANLNVAENIFLGAQPHRGPAWLQITNRPLMHARASELLDRVGLALPTTTQVSRLSLGQQQQVEIAKALSREARMLVFDEPTSSLAFSEAARLLKLIEELRSQGVAILYVSHRLEEVQQIADRAVVLRDGRLVGTLSGEEIEHDRMVKMMVGREIEPGARRSPVTTPANAPALSIKNLRFKAAKRPISFHLNSGEILGFAGLVGAGRTELARALFGIDPIQSGTIQLGGRRVSLRSPVTAVAHGLALVPEDRKHQGLVLEMSVRDNLNLSTLDRLGRGGIRRFANERAAASRSVDRFAVRTASIETKTESLSGGNQQKTVLAKWWASGPSVLILDEPTRGVDVGAKQEIYDLISQLALGGAAVMLISSEMEEIIRMCDRVMVMHEGRVTGELTREAITEENIMKLAVGQSSAP